MDSNQEAIKDHLAYWLAMNGSSFAYEEEATDSGNSGPDWSLDCGDACTYTVRAQLRRKMPEFATFDVSISGGTLAEEWKVFLLAFRGSVTLSDWLTNLAMPVNQSPFGKKLAVGVHSGWHADVSNEDEHEELREAIAQLEDASIVICGHSLGGARAQVAMLLLWLELNGLQANEDDCKLYKNKAVEETRCVTFGSPAPFMELETDKDIRKKRRAEAREWLWKQCKNFVNITDPVPRLPFNADAMQRSVSQLSLPESLAVARNYEHFCSLIMLYPDEPALKPTPHSDVNQTLNAVAPRLIFDSEHPLEVYRHQMCDKLVPLLAESGHQPLRTVSVRLKANPASIMSSSLAALSCSLQAMDEDTQEACIQPFLTTFKSIQQIVHKWQDLANTLPQLVETGDRLQEMDQAVRRKLEVIDSYLRTGDNYARCEMWEEVEKTFQALGDCTKEAMELMDDYGSAVEAALTKVDLVTSVAQKAMKLIDELRGFSKKMMGATMQVVHFVSSCADLGLSYRSIGLLLAVVAVCIGGVAFIVGGVGAIAAPAAAIAGAATSVAGAATSLLGAASPSLMAYLALCSAGMVDVECNGVLGAIKAAVEFARFLRRTFPNTLDAIQELLVALSCTCVHFGKQGFATFIAALTKLYGSLEEWGPYLKDELDQLMKRATKIQEKLKETKKMTEDIKKELQALGIQSTEVVSMACFIQKCENATEAEIAEKRKECKAKCQQMLVETKEKFDTLVTTPIKIHSEIESTNLSSPLQILQEMLQGQADEEGVSIV